MAAAVDGSATENAALSDLIRKYYKEEEDEEQQEEDVKDKQDVAASLPEEPKDASEPEKGLEVSMKKTSRRILEEDEDEDKPVTKNIFQDLLSANALKSAKEKDARQRKEPAPKQKLKKKAVNERKAALQQVKSTEHGANEVAEEGKAERDVVERLASTTKNSSPSSASILQDVNVASNEDEAVAGKKTESGKDGKKRLEQDKELISLFQQSEKLIRDAQVKIPIEVPKKKTVASLLQVLKSNKLTKAAPVTDAPAQGSVEVIRVAEGPQLTFDADKSSLTLPKRKEPENPFLEKKEEDDLLLVIEPPPAKTFSFAEETLAGRKLYPSQIISRKKTSIEMLNETLKGKAVRQKPVAAASSAIQENTIPDILSEDEDERADAADQYDLMEHFPWMANLSDQEQDAEGVDAEAWSHRTRSKTDAPQTHLKVNIKKGRAVVNSDDDDLSDNDFKTDASPENVRWKTAISPPDPETAEAMSDAELSSDSAPDDPLVNDDALTLHTMSDPQNEKDASVLGESISEATRVDMPSPNMLLNVLSGQFEALKAADAPKLPRSKFIDMEADEEDEYGLVIDRDGHEDDEEAEALLRNELNSFLTDMKELIADEPIEEKSLKADEIEKLYRKQLLKEEAEKIKQLHSAVKRRQDEAEEEADLAKRLKNRRLQEIQARKLEDEARKKAMNMIISPDALADSLESMEAELDESSDKYQFKLWKLQQQLSTDSENKMICENFQETTTISTTDVSLSDKQTMSSSTFKKSHSFKRTVTKMYEPMVLGRSASHLSRLQEIKFSSEKKATAFVSVKSDSK